MKLGILTFHNIPNIGAVLQAYSLCLALRKLGADCEIIDYTCENIKRRELSSPKTGNIIKDMVLYMLVWPKIKRKIKACQRFMISNKCYGKKKYNIDSISEANNSYDVFISGSDMIWNLDVTNHDWTYFCNFVRNGKKRFAYGSSIGGDWSDMDVKKVVSLLSQYEKIAVRESDTCKKLLDLGLHSEHVCDPTMLIPGAEWEKILVKPMRKNYVLVYFPSSTTLQYAERYAEAKGLDVLVMNWGLPSRNNKDVSPYSPEEWLGYFYCAEAVFTGSFHGLLFSLYFHKPVWTDNSSNRVQTLLNYLEINKCYLDTNVKLETNIDYNIVDERVGSFRDCSNLYLYSMLNNVNNEK